MKKFDTSGQSAAMPGLKTGFFRKSFSTGSGAPGQPVVLDGNGAVLTPEQVEEIKKAQTKKENNGPGTNGRAAKFRGITPAFPGLEDVNKNYEALTSSPRAVTQRYKEIPTSNIKADPQVRTVFDQGELVELAYNMLEVGQLLPIVVKKMDGEDGRYVIVDGERRWRAAIISNIPTLDCVVLKEDFENDDERKVAQLSANMLRTNLDPFDLSRTFKELVDSGLAVAEIARRLGKSAGVVQNYLTLLDAPEFLIEYIKKNNIRDQVLFSTLCRSYSKNPERFNEAFKPFLEPGAERISRVGVQKIKKYVDGNLMVQEPVVAEPTRPALKGEPVQNAEANTLEGFAGEVTVESIAQGANINPPVPEPVVVPEPVQPAAVSVAQPVVAPEPVAVQQGADTPSVPVTIASEPSGDSSQSEELRRLEEDLKASARIYADTIDSEDSGEEVFIDDAEADDETDGSAANHESGKQTRAKRKLTGWDIPDGCKEIVVTQALCFKAGVYLIENAVAKTAYGTLLCNIVSPEPGTICFLFNNKIWLIQPSQVKCITGVVPVKELTCANDRYDTH